MQDVYQKYSIPEWNAQGWEEFLYIPDFLLDPLLGHLRTHQDSPLNAKYGERQSSVREFLSQTRWSWDESVGFVLNLWEGINPVYRDRLDGLHEARILKLSDAEAGKGGGMCYEDYISFQRDGTINDPIYLAHETGHLVSHFQKETQRHVYSDANIAKLQAFFVQELAYRYMDNNPLTLPHRWMDYSSSLSRIPFCLWQIHDLQKKNIPHAHHPALRDVFNTWSFHDKETLSRYEAWIAEPGEESPVKQAQYLHRHPFAALLAPAMVDRYERSDVAERQKLARILYGENGNTTLNDILDAFGLNTPGKMRYAVNTCLKYLKTAEPLL